MKALKTLSLTILGLSLSSSVHAFGLGGNFKTLQEAYRVQEGHKRHTTGQSLKVRQSSYKKIQSSSKTTRLKSKLYRKVAEK